MTTLLALIPYYPRHYASGWTLVLYVVGGVIILAGAGIACWVNARRRRKRDSEAREELREEMDLKHPVGAVRVCPDCGAHNNMEMVGCVECGRRLGRPFAMQPDAQPGAPPRLPGSVGVVRHDILVGGRAAFRQGELVEIESTSPDPDRPDFKYVVQSKEFGMKYRLSDDDLMG